MTMLLTDVKTESNSRIYIGVGKHKFVQVAALSTVEFYYVLDLLQTINSGFYTDTATVNLINSF
ncbi:unnamed protein product [Leptidea sinapis]|uniref:Uncharacterized protein n=1 Tax=Leptidea sinapis TaxID=189913 RepID=A0A5E4Q173_9NEOP|nr:unnamed protein product [Leptidea sinapis]